MDQPPLVERARALLEKHDHPQDFNDQHEVNLHAPTLLREFIAWAEQVDRHRGKHDGVLYCYGGCGTRYSDFPRDVVLPTALWNRIAVGPPFNEQERDDREGRGGVLCPTCIVARLAALPECTVIFADIEPADRAAIQDVCNDMYHRSRAGIRVPVERVEEWSGRLLAALGFKVIG